jgi:hypothetical protein
LESSIVFVQGALVLEKDSPHSLMVLGDAFFHGLC